MDDPQASGVKTTPDMKRAFKAPGAKLEPHFFPLARVAFSRPRA